MLWGVRRTRTPQPRIVARETGVVNLSNAGISQPRVNHRAERIASDREHYGRSYHSNNCPSGWSEHCIITAGEAS